MEKETSEIEVKRINKGKKDIWIWINEEWIPEKKKKTPVGK